MTRGLAMVSVALMLATVGGAAEAPASEPQLPQALPQSWLWVLEPVEVAAGEEFFATSGAQALPPELHHRLRHAWRWSEQLAPHRLGREEALGRAEEPESEVLEIRIPTPRTAARAEGGKGPGEVIAAPPAMWAEVPEDLLPRWTAPARGRLRLGVARGSGLRLRLVGQTHGSGWVDVAPGVRRVLVRPWPVETLSVTAVAAPDDTPLESLFVTLLAPQGQGSERAAGSVLANFRGDERGRLQVLAVPKAAALQLLFAAPGRAPRVVTGTPGQLPRRVSLAPGAVLSGRLLRRDPETGERRPLAGARVQCEAWLDADADALFEVEAETGEDGRWRLEGVPWRPVALRAAAPGHAAWTGQLEVAEERITLGDVVLDPGASVAIRVRDDQERPVAGAEIRLPGGKTVETDRTGQARLEDLPADRPTALEISAAGHLASTATVTVPPPPRLSVTLTRALQLSGRLVRVDGSPASGGVLRLEDGSRFSTHDLEGDGSFRLDVPPGSVLVLALSADAALEVRVPIEAGRPGEVRDLGDITAPPGLVVAGRLLDGATGEPVAGGRVWLPKNRTGGQLLSWLLGDMAETTSDGEGRFALGGLENLPVLLRVDAPGRARAHVPIRPEAGAERLDLGDVWLDAGVTLEVNVPGASEEGRLQVDLRGSWNDLDLLTAPVIEGIARVDHVPAEQTVRLSVIAGREPICERQVTTPASGATLEVVCRAEGMKVRGVVHLGERPVGEGVLVWARPAEGRPAAILNHVSPSGLRRQQVAGAGPPEVRVPVGADGVFTSDRLAAGAWKVTWQASHWATAPTVDVELPDLERYDLEIRLPAQGVHGVVLDPAGQPAAGVHVRAVDLAISALTGADGTFLIAGLEPGAVQLEASRGELRSEVATAELRPGDEPPWVELRLAEYQEVHLPITVLDTADQPQAGALVWLEDDRGQLRLLTADVHGQVEPTVPPPLPQRVRVAAVAGGAWTLGPWLDWQEAQKGIVASIGATGTVVLAANRAEGSPVIEGPGGWNVSRLLTWLGERPAVSPEEAVVLGGLPAGRYTVALGTARRSFSLDAAGTETVEMD